VAVRRGLRGVTAGILALNFGIIVLLRIYPQDNQQLAVVQFLMLILSLTGLVLGAVISSATPAGACLHAAIPGQYEV